MGALVYLPAVVRPMLGWVRASDAGWEFKVKEAFAVSSRGVRFIYLRLL